MTTEQATFWENFNANQIDTALTALLSLSSKDQQKILQELRQKSEHFKTPDVIAVLHRELHDGNSFKDFYNAWMPDEKWCDPIEKNGQLFKQLFPAPVRVINAINNDDPKDIISIGFVWTVSDEQKQQMQEIAKGEDAANLDRRDKISDIAEKISVNQYTPQSDDNLGVPF